MHDDSKENESGIGEIFKGLGKLLNVVVDMAEKNINEKKISGDFLNSNNRDGLKGKYNFSMKLGLKDKDIGHIMQNLQTEEPQTDLFKEDGKTVVVVEMPGVKKEDFDYTVQDNSLCIIGKDNMKTYKKSLDIDELNIDSDVITVIENNGLFKIVIKHNKS
jgi:HSP20 family molecular chaperone IbpA